MNTRGEEGHRYKPSTLKKRTMYNFKPNGAYRYKYLIQMRTTGAWSTIMSFTTSGMTIQQYIDEQKEMHPNWEVRVIPNQKYKQ